MKTTLLASKQDIRYWARRFSTSGVIRLEAEDGELRCIYDKRKIDKAGDALAEFRLFIRTVDPDKRVGFLTAVFHNMRG